MASLILDFLQNLSGGRGTKSMKGSNRFFEDYNLIDLPLVNGTFTWSNLRQKMVCCRLDEFLFSNGWLDLLHSSKQSLGPRSTSDHWLISFEAGHHKWGSNAF